MNRSNDYQKEIFASLNAGTAKIIFISNDSCESFMEKVFPLAKEEDIKFLYCWWEGIARKMSRGRKVCIFVKAEGIWEERLVQEFGKNTIVFRRINKEDIKKTLLPREVVIVANGDGNYKILHRMDLGQKKFPELEWLYLTTKMCHSEELEIITGESINIQIFNEKLLLV